MEDRVVTIYVEKRPYVDYFLEEMSKHYEVIIFTASLSKYADPLMDQMDPHGFCVERLYREHCSFINGVFTKDMSKLGRPLKDVIFIDNSPTSYFLQPENALPILSWYNDKRDVMLRQYVPLLVELAKLNDVREVIPHFCRDNVINMDVAM